MEAVTVHVTVHVFKFKGKQNEIALYKYSIYIGDDDDWNAKHHGLCSRLTDVIEMPNGEEGGQYKNTTNSSDKMQWLIMLEYSLLAEIKIFLAK